MIKTDESTITIEIPAYITVLDLEKVLAKTMRQLINPGTIYLINMEKVSNVFNATIQLLLRIHDRAERLSCPTYIINASDSVCNALNSAGINKKIAIFQNFLLPEIVEAN